MSIDTSGGLLEGIRVSEGNYGFTFPPRSLVSNQSSLNTVSNRAEYAIIAYSSDQTKNDLEIADPNLYFRITKNEGSVVRFKYDSYQRRWIPSPGSSPDELGALSNIDRISATIPDTSVLDAPYQIYLGNQTRTLSFFIAFVATDSNFSSPSVIASGRVEQSLSSGNLNFSQSDVDLYGGQTVYARRQNFFDRSKKTGNIGSLPASSGVSYYLFLNPKPDTGQIPLIRIGYRNYLTAIQVADEASLGSPVSGTFTWSLDTGKIRLSSTDVDAYSNSDIYYDGVVNQTISFNRVSLPSPSSTGASFSTPYLVDDPQRIVLFAEKPGEDRYYFTISIISSPSESKKPATGNAKLDPSNGNIYLNISDINKFQTWSFYYIDTILSIEDGVSVQFYRSGVNGSGNATTSDFKIKYVVSDQIIVDGIGGSPFSMLPTTPIVDDDLVYKIEQAPGSTGTFVGSLVDGTDSSSTGYGYILNLDIHQLKYSDRKTSTITLAKSASSVKLPDGAIFSSGLSIKKNGVDIEAGTNFSFDPDTGLIEFLETVGQNESDAINDKSVTVYSNSGVLNGLQSSSVLFNASLVGKYVLIKSGSNIGVYEIYSYINPYKVLVTPNLKSSGTETISIVSTIDTIADHFWTELKPEYKKFSISTNSSILSNTEYSVFATTGQVNLNTPTNPDQTFDISYIALVTTDNGVTNTPTNVVERALFRVRLETATTTVGSRIVTFNPEGRTVSTARDIEAYLNGVPLDSTDFEFVAPNRINLSDPITSGKTLTLNYWVEEALGGETSFTLLTTPVDLDTPEIIANQSTASFNGDLTSSIFNGSPLFIGETEIVIVQSVSYDSSTDTTNVQFETAPTVASGGATIYSSRSILTDGFRLDENLSSDIVIQNDNKVVLSGQASYYTNGTIITIDNYSYSVISSNYDSSTNKTTIVLAAPAKKNYINPSIKKTIRPVLFSTSSLQAHNPINIDFDVNLFKLSSTNKLLVKGVDYNVSNGGGITLSTPATFGETYIATYVATKDQPAGTVITSNYSYAISPDESNGIEGQRLVSTYNLYAPDSFFYRIETVESFIPEVQDLLRSNSSSGSTGPSIQNASGQSNKDFGRASPYFNEQNYYNIDYVMRSLLYFYNTLINTYEDILSNLDGRIVGGEQGKFRFDNLIDNPARDTFDEITNDIDDRIKLFDSVQITGFFTFGKVPVYGTMATPNSLSRIFPTTLIKSAALNDLVTSANFGDVIGSFDIDNIKSSRLIKSTKSRAFFTKDINSSSYLIDKNGDTDNLIPQFVSGQDIDIYDLEGTLVSSATVVSADTNEPSTVILSFAAPLKEGSLMQNISDSSNSLNHYYTPGRDLIVDADNGQILNSTYSPPLNAIQNAVIGNEIVDGSFTLNNTDLKPKRISVLDGSVANDDGRLPEPLRKRIGEQTLINREKSSYEFLGRGQVSADLVTILSTIVTIKVGDKIVFINGPNAGSTRTVQIVATPTSFIVSPVLPVIDPTGSDFFVISGNQTTDQILNQEVGILSTNIPGFVSGKITSVNSEIKSIDNAISCIGTILAIGLGDTNSNTLTDLSAGFVSDGVTNGDLIHIISGVNRGLYKIISVADTSLIIETITPWAPFSVTTNNEYRVYRTQSFLSDAHGEFLTKYYRETLSFLNSTQAFLAAITVSGLNNRKTIINNRLSLINTYIEQVESLLVDDNLYETRYLWIDQRTNRRDGTLAQKNTYASQREEDIQKILDDQQKLLVANSL